MCVCVCVCVYVEGGYRHRVLTHMGTYCLATTDAYRYTPVARSWAHDDDTSTTFVWDVFFVAMMLATDAASERARDIAHANIITTVMSKTVTGMVRTTYFLITLIHRNTLLSIFFYSFSLRSPFLH